MPPCAVPTARRPEDVWSLEPWSRLGLHSPGLARGGVVGIVCYNIRDGGVCTMCCVNDLAHDFSHVFSRLGKKEEKIYIYLRHSLDPLRVMAAVTPNNAAGWVREVQLVVPSETTFPFQLYRPEYKCACTYSIWTICTVHFIFRELDTSKRRIASIHFSMGSLFCSNIQ